MTQEIKSVAENLILDVTTVAKDGSDWCVKCPHCEVTVMLPSGPVRGEQFKHSNASGCGGWFEVSSTAKVIHGL